MQGIICPTLITVQKHTTPENYYQILYYAARIQSSVKLYGSKGIYQKWNDCWDETLDLWQNVNHSNQRRECLYNSTLQLLKSKLLA